ncbi:virulence RhuM family protein [Microbacterium sp. MYb64]|uniref:virulence RhuM family protein n=1 Tax=Microbacterium sp. MYb64 TaxID=1848691 RepID=UPI000CFBB119|nr:virulence RhuM family protein [Microbacterium sp. MYb64]PRB05013.1 hydroxyacid dehydrogenase [Microbacterium sp. MYb64]
MAETDPSGEIVLYTTDDGLASVQLRAVDGTAWLSQRSIAELFQVTPQAITQHIQTIYSEGELTEAATCNDYLQVRIEGTREVTRTVRHYNLDMILAIGYRVRSPRGTQFRRWATTVLTEYLVKGFAMDDAKLKDAPQWDYFDEWLERIRDIRASEKRFYQKVTDLYATAVDYDSASDAAKTFFAKVQNKMLFAVTGKTAAEIVATRSDAGASNMGLTAWSGGRVRKADVSVGKNYLGEDELVELNRIVTMYLDFAEDQARRRQVVTMDEWAEKLDAFLQFNGRDLLTHAGNMQAAVAKRLAEGRYDEFDAHRRSRDAADADAADFAAIERLGRDAR